MQEDTISVQFVPKMRFPGFDFGVSRVAAAPNARVTCQVARIVARYSDPARIKGFSAQFVRGMRDLAFDFAVPRPRSLRSRSASSEH
eukprot:1968860-Rhodomonas_salina.4